ncbi:MAG: GGDEF domain-containing protein [Rhodospirillaceae bacterium]|jgi:diguanylate cyclase (GGDEF)-like protein|nr:GGDEF domain-containing protein [Rhodospirillaceae bacterium]MBT5458998.1 GGDEF domain-containing protein [Rhodospirillaceae bacterium]
MADKKNDDPPRTSGSGEQAVDFTDDSIPADARTAIVRLLEEIGYLRSEIEANNQRIEELENLADRDPLTPVVNRRAFVRELERVKAYGERYGNAASLIYLDLNGMKAINDQFGHAAGDQVLLSVAEALVANVRSSDLVGRLGGDEFGIILARADRKAAEEKAAILLRLAEKLEVTCNGNTIPVSLAYGIVDLEAHQNAEAALAAADRAMYERKKARDT